MRSGRAAGALLAAVALAGCSAGPTQAPAAPASEAASGSVSSGPADDPAYDVALSEPVSDPVYPQFGDPGVDALHYDLDLTWQPGLSLLTGREALAFRATADAEEVRLDLAAALRVSGVSLDGKPVGHRQQGADLLVEAAVVADERYLLEIDYSGTPVPTPAPTTRADLPGLGWTTTPDGSVWTMQEPFGAHTWYAVNDHPSDKALYDFTLRVPARMVGVANGELVSRTTAAGRTVTEWSLDHPAASYLVTVGIGDYETAEETSASGVPVGIWVPADHADLLPELRRTTVESLDWAEERLGPYPYDSLGFLFVDSTSGMETQTMITLGLTDYATSQPVLVHEVVHQWWGNLVTPRDWRDLWMNEGMTMYLQAMWESEHGGPALDAILAGWASSAAELREQAGPPGAYDPGAFAEGNVYYLPALMWHDVRRRVGDETFFRLVREWPTADDDGTADFDEITAWWERESGVELRDLFESHLYGERQP